MCKNKKFKIKYKKKKDGNILAVLTVTVVVSIGGLALTNQVVNSVSSYNGFRKSIVSKYNRDTTIELLEGFLSSYLENKKPEFEYQLTRTGRYTLVYSTNKDYIFDDLTSLESGADTYQLKSFEEQLKYYSNYLGLNTVSGISIELQPSVPIKDNMLWERLLLNESDFALILDGDFGDKSLKIPTLQLNIVVKEKSSNLVCKLLVSDIVAVRKIDSVESDYIKSHLEVDVSKMKVTYIDYLRE